MQTFTVTAIYGEDHDRLDELFHRFETLTRSDSLGAARAFAEFKAGLEQHIDWEEQILFPLLDARIGDTPDSWTAIMRWEHRHLRRHLERIERHIAQRGTDAELERIVFVSLLGSHNQKEERIVYPIIDGTVSEEECSEITLKMQQTLAGRVAVL